MRVKELRSAMLRARASACEVLGCQWDALPDTPAVVDSIVRAHQRMERIDAALGRMRDGTYGKCCHCGEMISECALSIQPWTECCGWCQDRQAAAMLEQLPADFKALAGRPVEAAWQA